MPSIRDQINIAAGTRSVWNALTTPDGLTSWWVDEARVDPKPGGLIVVSSEGDDGEPLEERGVFNKIRPTRVIEIKWDTRSKAPNAGTQLEFHIARDGDETRVSLVHRGAALDDEEQRDAMVKSWRQALKALRSYLED